MPTSFFKYVYLFKFLLFFKYTCFLLKKKHVLNFQYLSQTTKHQNETLKCQKVLIQSQTKIAYEIKLTTMNYE